MPLRKDPPPEFADWVWDSRARGSVQSHAVRALSGYLTDEAAEVLLRGMGRSTDNNSRDACRDALENIRSYDA